MSGGPQVLEAEIFFCERYRPLIGWHADYLMPTDKHAYRVRGAQIAWSSIEQAEGSLLAPGWSWDEPPADLEVASQYVGGRWLVDTAGQDVDKESWSYNTGFNGKYEGSGRRGSLLSLVRWKRIVRTQKYEATAEALAAEAANNSGAAIVTPYCPHFDIEGAKLVSRKIIDAVAAASLHGEWSDHALVELKRDMLRDLTANEGRKEGGDSSERFEAMLTKYVNSHKSVAAQLVESVTGADDISADLSTRLGKVQAKFPAQEIEAYAVLAIRQFHLDAECKASAEDPHTGECPLRPVFCPHEGCSERLSAKHLEEHDVVCQFKPTPCDQCGIMVPVRDLTQHKRETCPERYVPCSYSTLGCQAYVKVHELEKHLEDNREVHIKMMAITVVEQQQLIEQVAAKLEELEEIAAQQYRAIGEENQLLEEVKVRATALEAKEAAAEGHTDGQCKKILHLSWWESRKVTNAVYYETENQVKNIQRELAKHEVDALIKEVAQLNMKASLSRQPQR